MSHRAGELLKKSAKGWREGLLPLAIMTPFALRSPFAYTTRDTQTSFVCAVTGEHASLYLKGTRGGRKRAVNMHSRNAVPCEFREGKRETEHVV